MAATISNYQKAEMWPYETVSFDMTVIVSDQLENVSYVGYGPDNFAPDRVSYEIVVPPVGHDPVTVYHEEASDVPASQTVALRVICADPTNMKIRFTLLFKAHKGGGIS